MIVICVCVYVKFGRRCYTASWYRPWIGWPRKVSWLILSRRLIQISCQFANHFYSDNIGLIFFTARAYARTVLGVVILSVRPSVTHVDCDKTKRCTADIFIPRERAITLLLWYQEWLGAMPPSLWNLRSKWPTPLRKMPTSTDFHS